VDRFDNMRVFAKVVESASFTGAARHFRQHGQPACEET
jgi:DNA-binding transcriptional LysR family regulator